MPRSHLLHLASRFASTLRARTPGQDEVNWVRRQLSDREFELWFRMSSADQVHSISVAKKAFKELPGDEVILAAGLLHDVGKVAAESGVTTRVVAAVAKPLITPGRLEWLAVRMSFFSNLQSLLDYQRIGSELLQDAGSDEFVVRWAAEHHLGKEKWTVDRGRGEVLVRADYSAV